MRLTLVPDVDAHILSFLPTRARFAFLPPGRRCGARPPGHVISRREIVSYYSASAIPHTSDAAVYNAMVQSDDVAYTVTPVITWKKHVERHHTELYEVFGGSIVIGTARLRCDGLVAWYMLKMLHMVPKSEYRDGGYRDLLGW
jgi:hypothetical protein